MNLASFVEFDKGLLLLLPYLWMNLNETWWKDVNWWVLQLCWSKMSRQVIFKWTNYVILVIFHGFLWLFYFGAFLTMKTTFLGTSLNIIYVDNGQGCLEHISDFLYLERFQRNLIKTLSPTFENRLYKLLKT